MKARGVVVVQVAAGTDGAEDKDWRIQMRIAIPVEERNLAGTICASFGRAPVFLLYDTGTKESSFVENSALANPGGAGIKAAQLLVDRQASAVLTPRCGENAAEILKAAGISLFKTSSTSIEASIELFGKGRLPLLEEVHAGLSHHGGD